MSTIDMTVESKNSEPMPILNVPYFSQKEEEAMDIYGRKACGLTALRMVLAYYGKDPNLNQLNETANKVGAFSEALGWIHAGLVNIARDSQYDLEGYRMNYDMLEDEDKEKAVEIFKKEGASADEIKEFKESFDFAQKDGAISDIRRLVDQKVPVIASMEKSYAETTASHMVVIMGYNDTEFTVNDPWDFGPNHIVSLEDFRDHWTHRVIVILDPKKR